MDEVELKLRIDPADVPRLAGLPVLSGPGAVQRLESTYYDTPDLHLLREKVSFRVRRQDEGFVQTVKGPPRAHGIVQHRGEWEVPVPGPEPQPALLDDPAARTHLGPLADAVAEAVAGNGLKPMFASHVERTVRIVGNPSGGAATGTGDAGADRIEVAIDVGEIRTPDDRSQPIAEVELELKEGDPGALYRLARILNAQVPMRVERRTKAERGYALAMGGGTSIAPKRAGRIVFPAGATMEQALTVIAREGLAHLTANEPCVLEGPDPEGIHQMRVALRRFRSALSIFRGLIPETQRAELADELRWLTDELGAARDWDVFLDELWSPVEAAFRDSPHHAPAIAAFRSLAGLARARGRERAGAAVASPRYTTLLLRLGEWIETRGWRVGDRGAPAPGLLAPVRSRAGELLAKRHKQSRKRGAGFETLDSHHRHQLRIALKKLRYATEFFRPLYEGKAYDRYHRRLSGLQDGLGHLNDVATATRLIGGLVLLAAETGADPAWREAAGLVVGWHARGVADMEAHLVADWEAFRRADPFWVED